MTDTTLAAGEDMQARIEAQVPGFRLPEVPRRFAICGYDESDEPLLAYWGLETADRAVAFTPDGRSTRRSGSADAMCRMLGIAYDVDLVWLDDTSPGRLVTDETENTQAPGTNQRGGSA